MLLIWVQYDESIILGFLKNNPFCMPDEIRRKVAIFKISQISMIQILVEDEILKCNFSRILVNTENVCKFGSTKILWVRMPENGSNAPLV